MKLKKNLKIICLALFVFSSCARVKVENVEFCADNGDGANCSYTQSDDSRDLNLEQWNDEKFGMICSTAETFAHYKKVISKLCKLSKRCSFDDKTDIKNFGKWVDSHIELMESFNEVQ